MDWFSAGDYEIARQVLQRGVAACFVIGFVSAVNQFPALLGEHGLLPVPGFVARVRFRQSPSLFHWRYSDRMLLVLAWSGAALAGALVAGLPQLGPPWLPMVAFLLLWAGYLSIVNVGQTFYSFGWESLLLEAGFVVAFLGSNEVAPPITVILFCRWLLFRLEFGAGLIGNHVAQLAVPFFLFAPQPVASVAAGVVLLTQLWLVVTGNFAWLNALTIVLAFSAVDDTAFRAVLAWLPAAGVPAAAPAWFVVVVLAVTLLLVVLSYRPLLNLFARRQLMNASFNRYHLVNAYGAFGTVTKERFEVVVEGSDGAEPGDEAGWLAYEFRGKPGAPSRMPRQFAPYHLRLDWLMWFLALGARDTRWFETFLVRLLEGDRPTLALLRVNPFPDAPPRQIRARVYLYRFSTPAERRVSREWWVRSEVGLLVAPVSLAGRARA